MDDVNAKATATPKTCCAPECCADTGATAKATEAARQAADDAVRATVKQQYGSAVKAVIAGKTASCCGSSTASDLAWTDPITRDLYDAEQAGGLPAEALLASFGCGNPVAFSEITRGPAGGVRCSGAEPGRETSATR